MEKVVDKITKMDKESVADAATNRKMTIRCEAGKATGGLAIDLTEPMAQRKREKEELPSEDPFMPPAANLFIKRLDQKYLNVFKRGFSGERFP